MDLSFMDDVVLKKAELDAAIKTIGVDNFAPIFKEFFKNNPTVDAIQWQQYAPYFNDGDPCVFGIHGFFYRPTGQTEGGEDDEGFEYYTDYGWKYADEPFEGDGHDYHAGQRKVAVETRAELKILNDLIESPAMTDVLEAVFGDGVQITATAEALTVDEYDHD